MAAFWISVVDSAYRSLRDARAGATTRSGAAIDVAIEDGRFRGTAPLGAVVELHAQADGYEPERYATVLRTDVTQVVIGLRRPGQLSYTRGACRLAFTPVHDAALVRLRGAGIAGVLAHTASRNRVEYRVHRRGAAGDEILVRIEGSPRRVQDLADALRRDARVQVELMLPIEHGERVLGLTPDLVARFAAHVRRADIEQRAARHGLTVVRPMPHAGNAFMLRGAPLDYGILAAADALAASPDVVYVEPNLVVPLVADAFTPNDPLFATTPHLTLIRADEAWDRLDDVKLELRGGSPDITIAVIDLSGVAPDHPDLTATLTDGTPKLLASVNFAAASVEPQQVATLGDDHGTQCAGSATAAFDDARGLAGVAPNCHLVGARIGDLAADADIVDIYLWLGGFLNASMMSGFPTVAPPRAADVISSSWGQVGAPLASMMRDCLDFLTTYGRGGKGCVLCFSLPNSGYVDFTDPTAPDHRAWPTYEKTIAVGASIGSAPTNPVDSADADETGSTVGIATAVDRRALFSPYGNDRLWKPDLVAPSNTAYKTVKITLSDGRVVPALTPVDPVMACVRVGTGTVDGCPGGVACDDYDRTFAGTSHATPTVAGAVALMLSAQPALNWVQVRDILRATCVRIDLGQTNAIGAWQDLDGDGVKEYSRWFGAGRLEVAAAVALALDAARPLADVYARDNLADTGLVPSSAPWWASPDIWVRHNAHEPIPALAWSTEPPHQDPVRGQDNAVFCRVRNASAVATATNVYVRAMVAHWPGLEFVYPDDFIPDVPPGSVVPSLPMNLGTYLIGEQRIDALPPNGDAIVKLNWDAALIPPAFVQVGAVQAEWHPCLLLEVSPHDGPARVMLPSDVAGDGNLAQRNIAIVDWLMPIRPFGEYIAVVVGIRRGPPVERLIIDPARLHSVDGIVLHVPDAALMDALWDGVRRAAHDADDPSRRDARRAARDPDDPSRRDASRDEHSGRASGAPPTVSRERDGEIDVIALRAPGAVIEIPFRLEAGLFVPLLVAVKGRATGDLWISQRRASGLVAPGYGIRWRAG